VNGLHSQTEGL